NPGQLPSPEDPESSYNGLLEAKKTGKTRFIGLTNHKYNLAMEAIKSNLYDTIQYPLSFLSTEKEFGMAKVCEHRDIGLIAMKALAGGLITNAASSFAYLRQYKNIVPIWGIEFEWQLDEFIAFEKNPPLLDESLKEIIKKDRAELSGSFCRGCGYCLPCPQGIPISMAARMTFLAARSPYSRFINEEWREKMELINECTECNQCKEKCPYELNIPKLLKQMLAEYRSLYDKHKENI
ncbi:MAG: aldo/keto reductase, partial [Firmicutes bacterium]|nr:aldo/keto reductase [Bacillota bacterium]